MSTRQRCGSLIWLVLLASLSGLAPAHARLTPAQEEDRISAARERIAREGLSWNAGPTSVSNLDLTEMTTFLGLQLPPGNQTPPETAAAGAFPARWDWRELGGVTPVRDQGDCGCCWAFAATAAFEAALRIHTGEIYDLAEQHVLLCNNRGHGCSGGWMTTAYDLFIRTGGVFEACVPYRADDAGPCPGEDCPAVARLNDYREIAGTVRSLKAALLAGPVSLAMTVHDDFLCYTGGCYTYTGSGAPNHAVLLIGWDDSGCDGAGVWIAKNSWGSGWGEGGCFRIQYNTCEFGYGAHQIEFRPADRLTLIHTPLDDPVPEEAGYAVEAQLSPEEQVSSVELHYAVDGGAMETVPMPACGEGRYRGVIPLQAGGTSVSYHLTAEDHLGRLTQDPLAAPAHLHRFRTGCRPVCRFDFEQTVEGWEHVSLAPAREDPWHRNDYANHTPGGGWSFKCGGPAGEDYGDLIDAVLISPPIELPIRAELRFHHRIDAEQSAFHMGWAYDGGIVEVSLDGGVNWTQVAPVDGYPYMAREGATPGPFPEGLALYSGDEGWREERFDLAAFEGTARVRFHFGSDGALTGDGWWIDDVRVVGYPPGLPQTPVELLSAGALLRGREVLLEWRPAQPREFLGFHLERALDPEGPFARINAEMIPSDPEGGVSYRDELTDWEPVGGAPGEPAGVFYRILGIRRGSIGPQSLQVLQAHHAGAESGSMGLVLVPNPARGGTELRFESPGSDRIDLAIFDAGGRLVASPRVAAGVQHIFWNGCDFDGRRLGAGQYFVRMQSDGQAVTRRLTLIR